MKCKFHPNDRALNYCEVCDVTFCVGCSDESMSQQRNRQNPEQYRCFVCQSPMNTVEGNSHVPPFWSNLSRIYRYPLAFDALVTLVVVSLISAFFNNVGAVTLMASAAITLYGFNCLHQTANGNNKAPGLDACFSGSVAPLFYAIIVITSSFLSLMLITKHLGAGFGMLFGTFYMFALPAAIIIIAVEESLLSALDPGKQIAVIKATGSAYFVMLIFIFIMYSSTYVLTSFLISDDPSFTTLFISTLVSNYYWVVIFHIMGYLVYQNHSSLGYDINVAQEQHAIRSTEQLSKAELEVLIKSGEFDAAAVLARRNASTATATLWQWSMAFELTCIAGSKKTVRPLFNDYLDKLTETDKDDSDKISDAYLLLMKHHPQFTFDKPQRVFMVANALFHSNQFALVFKTIQDSKQCFTSKDDKERALEMLTNSRSRLQLSQA